MARFELYPKLVITVESTRTQQQVLAALDAYFADAQKSVRQVFRTDPQTRIVSWHMHFSNGSRDEPEPGG